MVTDLVLRAMRARATRRSQSAAAPGLERKPESAASTISVHLDTRALHQALHAGKAPAEHRDDHTDNDEEERQRGAVPILPALESAPVDVKRENCRVVERTALGEEKDVFEADEQR